MKKYYVIRGIVFLTLICLILCFVPSLNSETSRNEELGEFLPLWYQTYGGTSSDAGDDVKQTEDGGFIIVGGTESYGNGSADVWLIKTDAEGEELWNKTFGSKSIEYGIEVMQTDDNGFLILGTINDFDDKNDVWLIKTDRGGNELWNKTLAGPEGDIMFSIRQTSDEGFILVGGTTSFGQGDSDVWLVKTDSNCTEQWNRTFGGNLIDVGHAVEQTSDGGFILLGDTTETSHYSNDFWVIKTNETGVMEWNQTYGGSKTEEATDILINPDGSYIVVGSTQSYGVDGKEPIGYLTDNIWMLNLDSSGTELWNQTYGGALIEYGVGVQRADDGGYVIAGVTGLYMGERFDINLIKTDPLGNMEWYKSLGGADYDFPSALIVDDNGTYVILGTAMSFAAGGTDAILIVFDPKPPGPIQNYAPVCLITSPKPSAEVSGTITIQGTAYDPEGYYIYITARIDDGPWYYALGIENWSVNLNTSALEDGDHTVYARAYDGIEYSDYENHSVKIITNNSAVSSPELTPEDDDDNDYGYIIPIIGIIIILIFIALFVFGYMTRKKSPPPGKGRPKPGRELQDSKINSPLRKY
jgi:hypothetical protein